MIATLIFALAQLSPTLAPLPSPRPTEPVYVGNPAARLTLESRPLGIDPDGYAKWLIIARYLDAQGAPTKIMLNTDLDWMPDHGAAQWQARMRFGQPSAIVRLNQNLPVRIRVRSNMPKLSDAYSWTDPRVWPGPHVVAAPLGPHMIQVGWFPRESTPVRIVRTEARGRIVIAVGAPSQTYRDVSVRPGTAYRYTVYRANQQAITVAVRAMAELPAVSAQAVSGKGVWLYFGTNPYDDHYVGTWNAQTYVDRAVSAGLHYVELRTAYGAYWEVDPQNKMVLDAIIDGLAAHGIGVLGWTVPRQDSFEDLAASVRTANYRTARGTPLAGLAVDYERGDEFMHDCPEGCRAIADYARYLRQAVGPNYKLVATIEDPYLEKLDNTKYPYAAVARYSDAVQPMTYWRMLSRKTMDVAKMESELQGSYQKVLRVSGRSLPISIGGQTSAEGPLGSPPVEEVTASMTQAKALGAIGECFFDWDGTQPEQWDAIARTPW